MNNFFDTYLGIVLLILLFILSLSRFIYVIRSSFTDMEDLPSGIFTFLILSFLTIFFASQNSFFKDSLFKERTLTQEQSQEVCQTVFDNYIAKEVKLKKPFKEYKVMFLPYMNYRQEFSEYSEIQTFAPEDLCLFYLENKLKNNSDKKDIWYSLTFWQDILYFKHAEEIYSKLKSQESMTKIANFWLK